MTIRKGCGIMAWLREREAQAAASSRSETPYSALGRSAKMAPVGRRVMSPECVDRFSKSRDGKM